MAVSKDNRGTGTIQDIPSRTASAWNNPDKNLEYRNDHKFSDR